MILKYIYDIILSHIVQFLLSFYEIIVIFFIILASANSIQPFKIFFKIFFLNFIHCLFST